MRRPFTKPLRFRRGNEDPEEIILRKATAGSIFQKDEPNNIRRVEPNRFAPTSLEELQNGFHKFSWLRQKLVRYGTACREELIQYLNTPEIKKRLEEIRAVYLGITGETAWNISGIYEIVAKCNYQYESEMQALWEEKRDELVIDF